MISTATKVKRDIASVKRNITSNSLNTLFAKSNSFQGLVHVKKIFGCKCATIDNSFPIILKSYTSKARATNLQSQASTASIFFYICLFIVHA